LFQDAATEVGIDQSRLDPSDGLAERRVADILFASELPKPSIFENPHDFDSCSRSSANVSCVV
jgi:hypothetical protein